jgi:hypothetical protein
LPLYVKSVIAVHLRYSPLLRFDRLRLLSGLQPIGIERFRSRFALKRCYFLLFKRC